MLTAKDIMTKDVITVKPDTSIEELASLLVENEISGAPVVDDSGNLYGIVTENDLISRNKRLHIPTVVSFLDAAIYLESSKKFEQEVKRLTATKVGEICTRKVVTITEDASDRGHRHDHGREKGLPASGRQERQGPGHCGKTRHGEGRARQTE